MFHTSWQVLLWLHPLLQILPSCSCNVLLRRSVIILSCLSVSA